MKLVLTVLLLGGFYSTFAKADAPVTVNLHSAKYFNQVDYDRLMSATKLVETIINSATFKDKVLNFTYNGEKTFVQNNGLTNEQIYNLLMSGAEKYPKQTAEDRMMDYDLELYTPRWYQSHNVIGYTNQNTLTISINRLIYQKTDIYKIAMNLVHEWVHKMGFDHDFNSTARRPSSVPYAVGYIVRDMGKELTGANGPDDGDDGSDLLQE
jgi:hypothetical protein